MIPKIIHYIWLGGKEEPEILKKCKASWEKFCPDYEIKRWDESNLNLDECKYAKEAYDSKKFAFASDYLRFKVLYDEGGIYLDIDVELLKSLDDFLNEHFFTGFEKDYEVSINPGLVCGAEKNSPIVKEMLDGYQNSSFINEDGTFNLYTVCDRATDIMLNHGLVREDKTQHGENWSIFSSEYFCPLSPDKIEYKKTKNTHSVHLYYASWRKKPTFVDKLKFVFKKIIGRKNFYKLKKWRDEKKQRKNKK